MCRCRHRVSPLTASRAPGILAVQVKAQISRISRIPRISRISPIITLSLLQHCFPEDGSHHFVCCEDIQLLDNPHSPHGNYNPLGRVIKAASNSTNYSWCTCSEEICTEQLGGRVAWNQNGVGWKGYVPPPRGTRNVYSTLTGPEGTWSGRSEL
jgi:hypothetical protein